MKYVSNRLKEFKQAYLVIGLSFTLALINSSGAIFSSVLASSYMPEPSRLPEPPQFPQPPESKGNKGQTKPIALPGRIAGSVSSDDAASYELAYGNNRTGKIRNFFRFTVPPGPSKQVDIMLSYGNPAANLDLFLFQQQVKGLVILAASTSQTTQTERLNPIVTLDPGTYLIGISALSGSSDYQVETKISKRRLFQLNASPRVQNDTVTVPVSFVSEGDENDLTFSLNFNPVVLGHPQVFLGADSVRANLELDTRQVGMGRIGIRLSLPGGQRFQVGAGEILKIIFLINRGVSLHATAIDFADRPTVRENLDRDGSNVTASYQDGTVILVPGFEADVSPRHAQDGEIKSADWMQIGRFVAGLDFPSDGSEFQRADCAPVATQGDGQLTVADWVVARRYAAGREPLIKAGGPTFLVSRVTGTGRKKELPEGGELELQSAPDRLLHLREATLQRGRESELQVELVSRGDENAVGFSVSFDQNQLNFVRASVGPDASGASLNINTSNLQDGRVGIALVLPLDQTLIAGERQIVNLVFSVPESTDVNSTTVGFDDGPVMREIVNGEGQELLATYTPGVITLDPQLDIIPALTGLNPSKVTIGSPAFTMNVYGRDFESEAVVLVNGVARATEFIGSTQLRVTVLETDIQKAGQVEITVQNSPSSRGVSNALSLVIVDLAPSVVNPQPFIKSLNQAAVAVHSTGVTLTINGTGFVPGSVAQWNGRAQPTTFIAPTQLMAQIPETDLSKVGAATFAVVNPGPGGGISNPRTITITQPNPLPRLASLSPNSVQIGSEDFQVMVSGTDFVPGALVQWNGNARLTTFVSPSQLMAKIPAADATSTGPAAITVINPSPGGGASNALIFSIWLPNPSPTLLNLIFSLGLEKPILEARNGGPSVTLTINGANFINGAVVQVNGSPRPTTLISGTQLSAQLTTTDLAGVGKSSLTVTNPAPGGGTSNPLILTLEPQPVCQGSSFNQVQLSTGFDLSTDTSFSDLVDQMIQAMSEKRTPDLAKLAMVLGLLNERHQSGRCRQEAAGNR